ncbi:ribosome biogenesis GTPase YlqF [Lactiplantibacillus mudanjiangensis]|uniref:Ribosome biogenesis GTPase A n=1 Tax=Lactiplantibacillus mudanjiangensis TaxID=1296538 RepID=A0A660E4C7_9LACO|nr:ribosome biogenesis GTPase YlqF [Lactiplantibacillus mudanjiangensis]VDG20487.1 ribosome biogenesis GTPase YlqF [Lactobacillus sp.] [Lactiplantibacillus mudanjiangensis]VDG24287.1 ribosome biogenesis GTPase YlqF [Lactobacillus sp.] [Lactiplantibacillus mudanjiangensis]VDG30450.1 ribosome biogenesis GTPase YlqF [Lactobacillus sp.] [Lactiplantibacillus mudanjiangensis]VDG30777.1 ribosome biogenesis GTPase YlqF [Lactobacillus sp.] [Lactiplantibacillus mudanjiangensis]
MANIQWYPGHMAKAIHQIEDKLHLVDIVFELVDARIPEASRNPDIEKVIQQKPHLLIMTKKDLADPQLTANWVAHYEAQGQTAIAIDSRNRMTGKQITQAATTMLADKLAKIEARGITNRPIRAVCVGIPNVGKSTLLNHIVNKKIAKVGDRPGVTKGQQWLKASNKLELLDTPGILWPKFEDQVVGTKLAVTGAIKENIYPNDDVALFALDFFKQHYGQRLMDRYHLTEDQLTLAGPELLLVMTKNMGMREDWERFCVAFLLDIRKGRLGRFTLDWTGAVTDA